MANAVRGMVGKKTEHPKLIMSQGMVEFSMALANIGMLTRIEFPI